jgi:ribosomal-protein-alanine N-acetyltransferase
MEKMPYQPGREVIVPTLPRAAAAIASPSWQLGLPTLTGSLLTLRELRTSDARSLFAALTTEEVSRFISPPPSTVDGFERFIAWARQQRAAGQYVCFAIVPRGSDTAIGLFQVRSLDASFETAEWGFAMSAAFWGSGIFVDGARMVAEFAFEMLGTHRLEARAAVANGRGNGALRKLGAVQEGVLRRSLRRNGEYLDQTLWAILRDEWYQAKAVWGPRILH